MCVCECVSTRHLVLGTNSEIEVLTLANSGTNFFLNVRLTIGKSWTNNSKKWD